MSRFLSVGETIVLQAFGEQKNFLITEVLGVGGSCIAYKVKYYENESIPHIGILKEYCPAFLENENFERIGTTLRIPDGMQEKFTEGLEDFKRTYKVINEYLSNNISAANYHTVQIGLYEGNNTAYTLTSCDYGVSYDKVDNENLLSICKTMLSVTKAVELYHNAGFLHLDIKPKNILVLNDVADLIKLFDFDSLTSIDKLKKKEIYGVPIPGDFYVPELEKCEIRNIGIETDIFEIGATLFLKVFKRTPEVSDMSYDAKYDIDENELFVGVSPQAKNEFVGLLKKTLQISTRSRYKTTKELKDKLEKIISLISESKPYIQNLPKWQPSKNCIGRKNEIKEIKRRLDKDGYVFIKGIGGLGKSEVAKLFAEQYKDEYHTVQFCKFSDNLKSVVATMPINGINERNYENADELVKEKNKVLHSADNKTLIIVDNFNVTYDDFLREFLPSDNKSFKVIFTTRCTMAAEYYESKTYDLPKLSLDECKKLFFAHLSSPVNDKDGYIVEELVKYVDYNTLIIVLMAIAVRKSGLTLSEMLSSLEEQKVDSIETEFFHEYDFSSDEINEYNKIYAHLTTIFSISGLTDSQKEILKNATLISLNGIGVNEFVENCGSSKINKESVEDVVALGWLDKDGNEVISMHPIISDMFSANNEMIKEESYYNFAEYLEDFCNPDYCHFSIVLNKLACAKHLERRYIFESDEKKVLIAAKLGRMYECVYQPNNARKYLKKALCLAKDLNLDADLIYIYHFLGSVEKDFGTQKKAIEYYEKCIYEGKKLKNRFYYAVVESMIEIADCYAENNNKTEAYSSFLEALNYSKCFKLYEYISKIADELVDICYELDWKEKALVYKKVSEKYRTFADSFEEMRGISVFSKNIENGDFQGGLASYENVLSFQREELGEDSPVYKDLKRYLWGFYAINKQKEQALYFLNENLTFIESTSGANSIEMAKELAFAASVLIEISEFETAYDFSKRAIAICEENDAFSEYAYIEAVFSLVSVYLIQGKNNEASKLIEKIDFDKFSGSSFLSDIISSCGMVMCQLSQFDKIEPLCKELLERNNASETSKYLANIIMAIIYEQKYDLDKAEIYAEKAKQLVGYIKTEHIKKEWLVGYYRSIARIKAKRGNYKEAIRILSDFINSFDESDRTIYVLNGVYSDRALFYFYNSETENANADFKKCEDILVENKMPANAFAVLYNNIAISFEKVSQYEKAKEYLDKIVAVNPNVLSPDSYFEAIVCGNIGWISYNLGDINQAISSLKNAVNAFETLGFDKNPDYFKAKNNLAITLTSKDDYLGAYCEYSDIRKTYTPDYDPNGEMAICTNFGIIYSLFKIGKEEEAYKFSCDELENFEIWFGETSSIRVKAIIQMGGLFREFGYRECYDFFFLANSLIEKSGDFKSINYAELLNYLGVYLTDEENEHGLAKLKFEESKELFEELNATDYDMYPTVVKNLDYVQDLIMNEIISKMAKNMLNETQED